MSDIVLCTINARYLHTGFGLRYLYANLGELQTRTRLVEFDINGRVMDMAAALLKSPPGILGLGVYIWNVRECTALAKLVKKVSPQTVLVIGGPEVSHEWEGTELFSLCDYLIVGEADLAFAALCSDCLSGRGPIEKVVVPQLPDLGVLQWPYSYYTEEDLRHRMVYVEASRGCPFRCEFCLSSLDLPVRAFETNAFLQQMEQLYERGARRYKFVDRTFNLHAKTCAEILRFFLARMGQGLFVHFEIVPDRLPGEVLELLAQFPPGSLQLEAGIQTFDPDTAARISRRQDYAKTEDNIRWLLKHTHAHLHADLIAGLPGETFDSFGRGFDRLRALDPHEIQVGILKRLKGTPIARHDAEWDMRYNPDPPYEILQNSLIPFSEIMRLRRFASYFDIFSNRGRFPRTVRLLVGEGESAFAGWMRFSDWLFAACGRTDSLSQKSQTEFLQSYLVGELGRPETAVNECLVGDRTLVRSKESPVPPRQQLHVAASREESRQGEP